LPLFDTFSDTLFSTFFEGSPLFPPISYLFYHHYRLLSLYTTHLARQIRPQLFCQFTPSIIVETMCDVPSIKPVLHLISRLDRGTRVIVPAFFCYPR
jgi:hypothetical protein